MTHFMVLLITNYNITHKTKCTHLFITVTHYLLFMYIFILNKHCKLVNMNFQIILILIIQTNFTYVTQDLST